MKRITLILGIVLINSHVAHADFSFHSGMENMCDHIAGNWVGNAKLYNWLIGECVYHGSGITSEVDLSGQFTLDVSVNKDSGKFICPKQASVQLMASCDNGQVTIKTDYGSLLGSFSDVSGNAQGTLTISPGIKADISIQFQRKVD